MTVREVGGTRLRKDRGFVRLTGPGGGPIGLIRLPEVRATICLGAARRNRRFMTASQSLYALYAGSTGAHIR